MQVAGRLALMPLTVLEKVFSGSGGGDAEEDTAADQAAQQAQQSAEKAERTMTAGDYSANLRSLARYRAEAREIKPVLWERVPEALAGYLKALSLTECEILAKQDLKTVSAYLEGQIERIDGVRTVEEVVRDLKAAREVQAEPNSAGFKPTTAGVSSLQASINAAVAQARGTTADEENKVGVRI